MDLRRRREPRPRSGGRRAALLALALLWAGGCRFVQPPVTPDPGLLGCYRLVTNLPASYADSLGYELPDLIRLGFSQGGQWTVVPTDPDWHPSWGEYDALPSGYLRRARGAAHTSPMQWDSVSRIPGDSIDVVFPGPIGSLTLRLGGDRERMGGRAEWVVQVDQYFLNEGVRVEAIRSSCAGLEMSLRRTRYR